VAPLDRHSPGQRLGRGPRTSRLSVQHISIHQRGLCAALAQMSQILVSRSALENAKEDQAMMQRQVTVDSEAVQKADSDGEANRISGEIDELQRKISALRQVAGSGAVGCCRVL
jgi:hypothetical protein